MSGTEKKANKPINAGLAKRLLTSALLVTLPLVAVAFLATGAIGGTAFANKHNVPAANGPALDASSPETLGQSVHEMLWALPESQRNEFAGIIEYLLWRNTDIAQGRSPDAVVQFKPWHGYSAERLIALHRNDYKAFLSARNTQQAQLEKEARAARIKEGHAEVRRLKAEIAREPEILATLAKVELRSLDPQWKSMTVRRPPAEGGGEFRGYFLDLDFVLHNSTDINLEQVSIKLDLIDTRDGSIIDQQTLHYDFGPPEDPISYRVIGDADPIRPGTSRRLRSERLFEVDDLPMSNKIDIARLRSRIRVNARAISIEDVQGNRAVGLWQIGEARKHLEAWQEFLEQEQAAR